MNIIIADDEPLALEMTCEAVREVCPEANIYPFSKPSRLLEFAKETRCKIAFLDICMRGVSGIDVAKQLKEIIPDINIIFVTGYDEYTKDAMAIHASGYIEKPVTAGKVRKETEDLRYPLPAENEPRLKIQCFGNFEIFVGGRALAFKRSKSKELLAYLVDRNGATCTNGEMLAVLWEDKPDTASLHSHLRNLIFDLSHTLEDAGVTGLLIRGRSTLALDTSKVDCDYYNFLRGSRSATNSYRGEYMTQYSWAEVTRSALRQQAAATPKSGSIPSYYVPPTGF